MGRANQKARTRQALLRAAAELLDEGHPPSMPEAAERALVSVATAYRYYRTADELWDDAASYNVAPLVDEAELEQRIEAAGDDVEARLEILVRAIGWAFLDKPVLARRAAKASLDGWFAQQARGEEPRSNRPRNRNRWNALALRPLRDQLEDHQVDAIVEALGLAWGSEPTITLLDVLDLSPEAAKERMLTAALWILRSGLAAANADRPPPRPRRR